MPHTTGEWWAPRNRGYLQAGSRKFPALELHPPHTWKQQPGNWELPTLQVPLPQASESQLRAHFIKVHSAMSPTSGSLSLMLGLQSSGPLKCVHEAGSLEWMNVHALFYVPKRSNLGIGERLPCVRLAVPQGCGWGWGSSHLPCCTLLA